MNKDSISRAANLVALRFVRSPWNEKALLGELQRLLGAKQKLAWMKRVVAELVSDFDRFSTQSRISKWLQQNSTFVTTCKRSKLLRELAGSSESVGRKEDDVINMVATQLSNNAWNAQTILSQLQNLAPDTADLCEDFSKQIFEDFHRGRPSRHKLHLYLLESTTFGTIVEKSNRIFDKRIVDLQPVMQPHIGQPNTWRVPELVTVSALALWLGMPTSKLLWLADHRRCSQGRHYRQRWSRKRSGGWRLIESPKSRLKQVQRDILGGILDRIPVHPSAHGFCVERNIKTFVRPHLGQDFAMRLDLQDFFACVQRRRVEAIFRSAGYPSNVSELLSRLSTTTTATADLSPSNAPISHVQAERLRVAHLPQGAPSSPALANLAAFRLDCRLSGLARKHDAKYTRYADDLLFSGGEDFRQQARRFHIFVLSVVLEEDFAINARKTRFMSASSRQKAAGLVFNQVCNTPRRDYEQLRATLHNCRVHGPESQNREAHPHFAEHLLGRVNFHAQVNPTRGARLKRMYDEAFSR